MKISVFLCLVLSLFLPGCGSFFNVPKADMTIAYPETHFLTGDFPRSQETMAQPGFLPDTVHARDSLNQ